VRLGVISIVDVSDWVVYHRVSRLPWPAVWSWPVLHSWLELVLHHTRMLRTFPYCNTMVSLFPWHDARGKKPFQMQLGQRGNP